MKNSKPLKVTLYIGDKQIEELTPDQKERLAQRLTETMSRYYAAHPEEFAALKKMNFGVQKRRST